MVEGHDMKNSSANAEFHMLPLKVLNDKTTRQGKFYQVKYLNRRKKFIVNVIFNLAIGIHCCSLV